MKRHKAAVIGGSGYGAARSSAVCSSTPTSSSRRSPRSTTSARTSPPLTPTSKGSPTSSFQKPLARGGRRGHGRRIPGPAAQGGRDRRCRRSLGKGARIIDLSGDFRLKDAASYERYYGGQHPCPELLLARRATACPRSTGRRSARRYLVASPGCFATDDRAGPLAPREGGPAPGRGRGGGHHRVERQRARRRRPAPATRCARSTCGPTSRSTTSTSRRSPRR